MLPPTTRRVVDNSSAVANARIRDRTERRLMYYARNPELIDGRLRELDREWDIERMVETSSSTLSLAGFVLAVARRDRRWLLLPFGVSAFMLQHALQGWCPPIPLLRRLGVRTASEIDAERYALKALRGDFGPGARRPGSFRQLARQALEAASAS
ncbi:hypothetical protein [Pedomonas mirosovicensis]|uniref:hypothetical protein n=1 Tax=Pedomonas mirosovicensis TaxID=2908641 RepID=UPI00216AA816|nr:hypothetical protein [Pedomonas mirosovicensis]MCH8683725.1 hypothetical protein [Pedomonas mirosovicensis]MCH8686158.1 hypothetical protein [Pedomonas mirosovicensis]